MSFDILSFLLDLERKGAFVWVVQVVLGIQLSTAV